MHMVPRRSLYDILIKTTKLIFAFFLFPRILTVDVVRRFL